MTVDTNAYPFAADDPFQLSEAYATLRRHDPLARVVLHTGDSAMLVTRYADAQAVLSDQRFSCRLDRPEAARLSEGTATNLSNPLSDPPDHTRWRKLISRTFAVRPVEAMRDRVQAIADELLDTMVSQRPPADILETFAFPLSMTVISEMIGIPVVERARFRGWVDTTLAMSGQSQEQKSAAYIAMAGYVNDLIAAKRENLGDDLVSRLITTRDEENGALSDGELLVTVLALIIGGYETVAHQIGKGLLALFRHPDQLAALRADPELVPSAVEEILRYAPIDSGIGQPRFATEEAVVGGVVIPRHTTLLVVRQSANRDADRFEDPDRFDVSRVGADRHLAFGYGPAFCVGAALARLEMRVAFTSLLTRLPRLALAVPANEIQWGRRVMAAGPERVPVIW